MTPHNNHIATPTIEDLTRRELLSSALAAALVIACGEDDEPATPEAMARLYRDGAGREVLIPVQRRRVVAMNDLNGGLAILELGVKPIGMAQREGTWQAGIADAFDLTGIAPIGNYPQADLEAIAALAPDLIITNGVPQADGSIMLNHQEIFRQLEAIAPVVVFVAHGHPKVAIPTMAEILGGPAPEQARRLQADYEARLADVRKRLPGSIKDVTVSFFHYRGRDFNVYDDLTEVLVLQDLGVSISTPEAVNGGVSIERLNEFKADVLLFWNTTASRVQDLPTWQTHPAVRAGQAVELPPRSGNGYTRAFQTLDVMEKVLLAPDFKSDIV